MNETPVARPLSSTVTSRTIAFGRIVRRPVASAGRISTSGAEKLDIVVQPRPHWPQ